ncbi:hypothetical protein Tco_0123068 [Tanacetum coccineum]
MLRRNVRQLDSSLILKACYYFMGLMKGGLMEGGRVMVDYWRQRGRKSVGGYLSVSLDDGCSNIEGSSVLGHDVFRDDLRFHGIGSGLRETLSHGIG